MNETESGKETTMNPIIIALATMLAVAPVAWADEDKKDQPRKREIRVDDLPKPIPELLQKIQQLSKKIEPEISKLGSNLGEELTLTVEKLCEELRCQEQPDSK
jgi:hypothetical protein